MEATVSAFQQYPPARSILETIWAHIVTFQVIRYLQGDMSGKECRRQRWQAVKHLLAALGERDAVLLFPSGGEGQKPWVKKNTEYFEKLIRTIINSAKRIPELNNAHFVPLVIENHIRSLFKSQVMLPWHPLSFLFRLLPDRSFQITIHEQVCLRDLLEEGKDAREIADYLMTRLKPEPCNL
jgi:hypothetical protein